MKWYLAALTGMLLSGCAAAPEERPLPEPESEEMTSVCANIEAGYQVAYPPGWLVSAVQDVPACALFNPTPVMFEQNGGIPLDVAVTFFRHRIPYEPVQRGFDPERVHHLQFLTVDGRPAFRVESVEPSAGEAGGVRAYRYVIDLGDSTLIASTYAVGLLDYALKKSILDNMMETITFEGEGSPPLQEPADRRYTRG